MSLNEWNLSNQCMSYIMDKNDKIRRCQNKTKSDFCIHHNEYNSKLLNDIKKNTIKKLKINTKKINKEIQEIMIENYIKSYIGLINDTPELDKKYKHNLLNLYGSWDEIELSQRIMMANEVWVVNILINHITNQLNHSNMENPYPIFPSNPFNRKLFLVSDLLMLKKRIKNLNIKINIALKVLLTQSTKTLTLYYDEAQVNPTNFSSSLLEMLTKQMRFMLSHEKNSQSSYIGMWAPLNFPLTHFEKFYRKFMNIPYQFIINDTIYDNPFRETLKNEFELFPFNNYNMFDNEFCDFL